MVCQDLKALLAELRHKLNLHFSPGYTQQPNTLDIVVDSVEQDTSTACRFEVVSHNIVGDFHTDFAFCFDAFTLSYGVIGHVSLHGIETDLGRFDTDDYSSQNALWCNTYKIIFRQYYKFECAGWRLSCARNGNVYLGTFSK